MVVLECYARASASLLDTIVEHYGWAQLPEIN